MQKNIKHNSKLNSDDSWLLEISPKTSFFFIDFLELWRYRDLLVLFVKRDVITVYKQTILGPLWYLVQPLFTSLIFTIVFNSIAGIGTGAIPPFLFNLAGITVWNYFTACLNDTSDTFKKNAAVFGKVYFPRVLVPLSIVISNLLKFGIQMLIFIIFYSYYSFKGVDLAVNSSILFFPVIVFLMAILGLGLGMVISSLVTKYRDLTYLVGFGVQLLMYISAVMYPLSLIESKIPSYSWVIEYNPLAYIIEATRYMLLNVGRISLIGMIYSVGVSVFVLIFGLIIFNHTEKSFIDTV